MKPLTKHLLASLVMPALIMIFRPFQLSLSQCLILSCLVFTLYCWTTGCIGKIPSSCFLLVAFLLLGKTPVTQVFSFPLSGNFLTIVFAFLFSQGIVNANLASGFARILFTRFGKTPAMLLAIGFLMAIAMIFVIPQPFSRAILIAAIMQDYLNEKKAPKEACEAILFGTFVFGTASYLLFSNGDIILNSAAIRFASSTITATEWIHYMMLPSLVVCALIYVTFVITFRKDFNNISLTTVSTEKAENTKWASKDKRALVIVLFVIVLGMTESLHHIPYYVLLLFATCFMFINGTLKKVDLKVINIDLLFFLTASFSIGSVLKNTGVADIIFSRLTVFFPTEFSVFYVVMIVGITMILHMILGSTITTLSIVIPGLLTITQGIVPVNIVMLLAYISVNIHYMLPFHHVTIMIGAGNQYFSNKAVTRYGMVLTLIVLGSIVALYLPWWTFQGLLS